MPVWTDPPINMRKATPEGEFTVACLFEVGEKEKADIFRRKDLGDAQKLACSIIEEGGQARIYDRDGAPVS